jgi:hypothetical protein
MATSTWQRHGAKWNLGLEAPPLPCSKHLQQPKDQTLGTKRPKNTCKQNHSLPLPNSFRLGFNARLRTAGREEKSMGIPGGCSSPAMRQTKASAAGVGWRRRLTSRRRARGARHQSSESEMSTSAERDRNARWVNGRGMRRTAGPVWDFSARVERTRASSGLLVFTRLTCCAHTLHGKKKISLHFLRSANIVQKSSYTAKVNTNISY